MDDLKNDLIQLLKLNESILMSKIRLINDIGEFHYLSDATAVFCSQRHYLNVHQHLIIFT